MNNERSVKSRIKELLRERHVSENQLSKMGRFSQKVLNGQISHEATLTVEMVLFILKQFPDVSADWLIKGENTKDSGNVGGDNNIANCQNTTANDTDAVRGLIAQLSEKDKQIAKLLQIIEKRPMS